MTQQIILHRVDDKPGDFLPLDNLKPEKIINFARGPDSKRSYTRLIVKFEGIVEPIEVGYDWMAKAFPAMVSHWFSNDCETDSEVDWGDRSDDDGMKMS